MEIKLNLLNVLIVACSLLIINFIWSYLKQVKSNLNDVKVFKDLGVFDEKIEPFKQSIIMFEYMGSKCIGHVYSKSKTNNWTDINMENLMVAIIYEDGSHQTKSFIEINEYLKKHKKTYTRIKFSNII